MKSHYHTFIVTLQHCAADSDIDRVIHGVTHLFADGVNNTDDRWVSRDEVSVEIPHILRQLLHAC